MEVNGFGRIDWTGEEEIFLIREILGFSFCQDFCDSFVQMPCKCSSVDIYACKLVRVLLETKSPHLAKGGWSDWKLWRFREFDRKTS